MLSVDSVAIKPKIREFARSCGFEACGFASAGPVSAESAAVYRRWISEGRHFSMQYMENYLPLRENPALLLEGAETVISVALNYFPRTFQKSEVPQFAYYAYGRDYHDVMRERLSRVAEFMEAEWGCRCRICVDTAPLRERYWAQRAGIGFVGRNNQLIIPGKGSFFFLGEIVTTLALLPDPPCEIRCGSCRKCVDACPASALPCDYGALDASRCISCLTIEHRGDLPENVAQKLGNRVYGCDECQKACPHNRDSSPTLADEFAPSQEFLSLTAARMEEMTEADFRRIFKGSAVKRTKYAGLMRNLKALKKSV